MPILTSAGAPGISRGCDGPRLKVQDDRGGPSASGPRDLFELAERQMSAASLEQWDRIQHSLTEREWQVLDALYRLLRHTGASDATGGEVAEFAGLSVLNTRPRLTGLEKKSLVERTEIRASHAPYEQRSYGYRPTLPRAAVERAQREKK